MNNERRNRISNLISSINGIDLESLHEVANDLAALEQESYDNMPEGLQCSERGEKAEAAIGSLEDAMSSIQDAVAALEEAINALEEAQA